MSRHARRRAPFGSWSSPVSSTRVAAAAIRLGQIVADSRDLYWLETRPDTGRTVVVRRTADGTIGDVTPDGSNVRTRVYEYGGAPFAVRDGTLYYVEWADQRFYRMRAGQPPVPVTAPAARAFADATVHPGGGFLICVCEARGDAAAAGGAVSLVSIALDGSGRDVETVAAGEDFYAAPRFSPDGRQLAWLSWRHPNMPWDGTELWVATVDPERRLHDRRRVAGGPAESIAQPGWSADGDLLFVSDRSGWWNLYRWRGRQVAAVCPMPVEFARPPWQLGTTTWAWHGRSRIAASIVDRGRSRLVVVNVTAGAAASVPGELEPADSLAPLGDRVAVIAGSARLNDALVLVDLDSGRHDVIRATTREPLPADRIAVAEATAFPSRGGDAHLFYYPPANPEWEASDARPPLLVIAHGGPTGAAHARLNLEVQFWTSRGFAVADVNYRGSTGYGRAYRDSLRGQWGVLDVADCVHAARYLIAAQKADPARVVIRGRSAGGFTALAALTDPGRVFRAAASYYGVSDLERLAHETHGFESRYMDGLIGPYPAARMLFRDRSPIAHVAEIAVPVIFFQGLDDPVVPPNQTQEMVDALRARGCWAECLMFAGEGHGFRNAATIASCLDAELAFYLDVFSPSRD